MLRYAVLFAMMHLLSGAIAQDLSELDKRNGFKDIKLTTPVDSVKGLKFRKDFRESDEFECKLYSVEHGDYEKIGEVAVKKVELKAYKGLIYEIAIVTEKDPRLMKALQSIFGLPEYDLKSETYFWKTSNITLKFRSHSKNLLELVYYSTIVRKMMKDDKGKKVEAIANDF
ncbi:MAG TPA: hypothetical protein VEB86_12890 [Chryseosolibacter sp.]|nr:hypothetical protein [Chryseosolibacter sp.]